MQYVTRLSVSVKRFNSISPWLPPAVVIVWMPLLVPSRVRKPVVADILCLRILTSFKVFVRSVESIKTFVSAHRRSWSTSPGIQITIPILLRIDARVLSMPFVGEIPVISPTRSIPFPMFLFSRLSTSFPWRYVRLRTDPRINRLISFEPTHRIEAPFRRLMIATSLMLLLMLMLLLLLLLMLVMLMLMLLLLMLLLLLLLRVLMLLLQMLLLLMMPAALWVLLKLISTVTKLWCMTVPVILIVVNSR